MVAGRVRMETIVADEFDPYAPGTGLKDDFDGTIMDTTMFVKVEGQQNMAFQLQVRADDGEEVEQRYGVGGEWMTYDGGKTVEHPKGHNRQFNGQTAYSQLIVNALMTEARELFYAANRNHDNRGPQYAEVWHGLRFHFKIVEVDGQQRIEVSDEAGNKTGEFEWVARKQNRMFPTAFLGIVGQEGTVAAPAVAPATPTTPPAASPTATATLTPPSEPAPIAAPSVGAVDEYAAFNALDMRDRAKMKLLAASAEDYRKFADQAAIIELAAEPGRYMIDVDPMMPLLSAEAFYVWLKG